MGVLEDFLNRPDEVQRWGNWLAELFPEDVNNDPVVPPGTTVEGLRVSSRADGGFRTRPSDTPASAAYRTDLAEANGGSGGIVLESSLWGRSLGQTEEAEGQPAAGDRFTIGGASVPNTATLVLANADGFYDQYRQSAGVRWDGRQAVLRFGRGFGNPSDPFFMAHADFRPFYFEMGEPTGFSLGQIVVPLYGLDRRLDDPITNLKYRGTGGTLHFTTATASFADGGTPSKLNLTGAMTVEGWFYADSLPNARRTIGWNGGTRNPWRLDIQSSGALTFTYTHSGGSTAAHTSTAVIQAGRWYHLAVIVSGTSGTFIIFDGRTGVRTIETFTLAAATRDSFLGSAFQFGVNSSTFSWAGQYDEIRVWNVARAISDIDRHRFGEIEFVPTTLAANYRCNDGAGSTVTDRGTGTAANLTLSGTTAWLHSLEGDAALAGRIKPDLHGRVEVQEAVNVRPATNIFQIRGIQDSGSAKSLQPYNGMSALATGGDVADLKTFIETSVPAGEYRTHLARYMFKLGSQPDRPVTATIAMNGTLTKGGLIRFVVCTRGLRPFSDPTDLDTAAFTQLDTDDPAEHGIFIPAGMTVRQVVDALIGPGYWWGFDFDSQLLTVRKWDGPAVTADLVIPASRILADPEPVGNLLRAWKVDLGFARIRPHTRDEITGSVYTNSPGLAQRGMENDGWLVAPAEDIDILDAHPHAAVHRFDTQYQTTEYGTETPTKPEGRDAAGQEAERLLGLYSSDWEAYKFKLDPFGLQIRLGDTVAPVVEIAGEPRLGFDGTRNVSVVALTVDLENNVTIVGVG